MGQNLLLACLIRSNLELILVFLYQVEVVRESVKLMLAEWSAQVDHKRDWDVIEHVLVQIFTQF